MDNIFEIKRKALADIELWNKDKSQMCNSCTEGNLYHPEEFIPYLVFDSSNVRLSDDGAFLEVTGRCTTCGSEEKRFFTILGR